MYIQTGNIKEKYRKIILTDKLEFHIIMMSKIKRKNKYDIIKHGAKEVSNELSTKKNARGRPLQENEKNV